jgi:plasmid stabilization system protein ParE
MAKNIIWSPAAESDLKSVLSYLDEKWSALVVNQFINKVDSFVSLIAEEPKLFPIINKKHNVRKCVLTKQNTLFYRENKDSIDIIRLFDTRQDPKKLKY